jgi:hypothetical protein
MTRPDTRIIDGETVIDREMTETEHEQFLLAQNEAKAQAKAAADKATARQAVLDRLGITADEAALLLG